MDKTIDNKFIRTIMFITNAAIASHDIIWRNWISSESLIKIPSKSKVQTDGLTPFIFIAAVL